MNSGISISGSVGSAGNWLADRAENYWGNGSAGGVAGAGAGGRSPRPGARGGPKPLSKRDPAEGRALLAHARRMRSPDAKLASLLEADAERWALGVGEVGAFVARAAAEFEAMRRSGCADTGVAGALRAFRHVVDALALAEEEGKASPAVREMGQRLFNDATRHAGLLASAAGEARQLLESYRRGMDWSRLLCLSVVQASETMAGRPAHAATLGTSAAGRSAASSPVTEGPTAAGLTPLPRVLSSLDGIDGELPGDRLRRGLSSVAWWYLPDGPECIRLRFDPATLRLTLEAFEEEDGAEPSTSLDGWRMRVSAGGREHEAKLADGRATATLAGLTTTEGLTLELRSPGGSKWQGLSARWP